MIDLDNASRFSPNKLPNRRLYFPSAVGVAVLLLGASVQAMLPTPAPEMTNQSRTYNNTIASTVVASVVGKDAQGNVVLTPITANTKLKTGNVINYQTQLTNNNSERLRSMMVTMAIPQQVKFTGVVTPKSPTASIDGTNYNQMPIRGSINGKIQEVPMQYYKALRWKIEGLAPNESATVSYQAVVR